MTTVDTLDDLRLTDATLQARMQLILDAPALLLLPERLLLYAVVRGVRPERALEIGTRFGGSASIICAALDDVPGGSLLCLDTAADVPPDLWTTIRHRATLLRGQSPADLAPASLVAGGLFDFIFIDGDYTADGVARDIDGVLTVAADGATILCHDAHYAGVAEGIDRSLSHNAGVLIDGGVISTLSTAPSTRKDGTIEFWGGLRLLRVAAH